MATMADIDSHHVLSARWDALTCDDLRARGGCKWSHSHPDTNEPLLGAGIAEHDLGLPSCIEDVLIRHVRNGTLGYPACGEIDRLSEALSHFAAHRYSWQVDPDEVTITADVLSVLRALILAVTEPGDAVIVPTPAYWVFRTIPAGLNRRLVEVKSRREGGHWVLDTDAIAREVDAGAKVVVLCNPWNPTGRVLSAAELDAFAEATVAKGAWVFSDEIHAPLTLPGHRHLPFVARNSDYAHRTVTATAASKAFNIPGLKCAQTVIQDPEVAALMADPLDCLAQGASTPGIIAATAAYTDSLPWLDAACAYIGDVMAEVYAKVATAEGIVMDVPEATYISLWDCSQTPARESVFSAVLDGGVMGNDGAGVGTGFDSYIRLNFGTGRAPALEIARRVIAAVGA